MTITFHRELEQGSQEWLDARCGILTASVIGKAIVKKSPDPLMVACPKCGALIIESCISLARKTPTALKTVHDERIAAASSLPSVYEPADNDTSRGLLNTLAAERITRHVDYIHPTFDMMRGTEDEPYARDAYAAHRNVEVEEVGFITLDTGGYKLGYSPDGLLGDDGLIEIKSRRPHSQLATILTDKVPAYNMAQLQAGLFVTGRAWIDYVSYSAGMPLYIKRVTPDQRWFDAISATANQFEIDVTNIVNNFTTAVEGLPMTERRAQIEEITF